MKAKSMKWYTDKLTMLVKERKGKVDAFLVAQIDGAAKSWRMLDKVAAELEDAQLTIIETGSQGQQKTVVNPLLSMFDKMSRTLQLQIGALGLNYDSTPSKVNETDAPGEQNDPLTTMFANINAI